MLKESFSSPLGEIIYCVHEGAVAGLWFKGQKYELAGMDRLDPAQQQGDRELSCRLSQWLKDYFSGKDPAVDMPLKPRGTAFQEKVWQELMTIPYGCTVSYGELADRIGCLSARAVGAAVGRNPIGILIPCHRVVGAGGKPTGYAWGIEKKKWRLDHEAGRNDHAVCGVS